MVEAELRRLQAAVDACAAQAAAHGAARRNTETAHAPNDQRCRSRHVAEASHVARDAPSMSRPMMRYTRWV